MKDVLDGQEIELTKLRIPDDPSDLSRVNNSFAVAELVHTASRNIVPIMNHVESIFGDLVRTPRPPAKLMEALAEVHWWTSHAMPDPRGSAAKTEMAVRAMAAAHGIELPPSGAAPFRTWRLLPWTLRPSGPPSC